MDYRRSGHDRLWYIDIMLAVGAALIHMPIKEAPKPRPAFASAASGTPVLEK